jgi:hypothetical protein
MRGRRARVAREFVSDDGLPGKQHSKHVTERAGDHSITMRGPAATGWEIFVHTAFARAA